jgi:hypothetical protein
VLAAATAQVNRRLFVADPLEIECDANAIRRRAAEKSVELHEGGTSKKFDLSDGVLEYWVWSSSPSLLQYSITAIRLKENLPVLFPFVGESLGVELVHLDDFNCRRRSRKSALMRILRGIKDED